MKKLSGILAVAVIVASAAVTPGFAVTAGEVADSLSSQAGSFAKLFTIVSFVLGVLVTLGGLYKFRQHSVNPNDPSNKLSSAIMLVFVGAAMVGIPAVLGMGISTVFGDDAKTTNATQGFTSLSQ